jgi:hypothetical protein
MRTKLLTLLLLSSVTFSLSCASADTGKLLIGKWQFMKFYTDDKITPELQEEINYFARANKGLTVRFSPNGEFESDQPGGPDDNNRIADYRVISNKIVIEKDTIQVVNVDQSFLVLSRDEYSPKIMFRRLNNTGTEPGRR